MFTRLSALLASVLTLLAVTAAKDKNKTNLSDGILQAQTVRVIVSPDTAQPPKMHSRRPTWQPSGNFVKLLQWPRSNKRNPEV
jgi:hypothetical protein